MTATMTMAIVAALFQIPLLFTLIFYHLLTVHWPGRGPKNDDLLYSTNGILFLFFRVGKREHNTLAARSDLRAIGINK